MTPNLHAFVQRPLARQKVMLSFRVIAYYGLIRASESATERSLLFPLAAPEERPRAAVQRFPNLLRKAVRPCHLPYPGGFVIAHGCYFLTNSGLRHEYNGSASATVISGLQSSRNAAARTLASLPDGRRLHSSFRLAGRPHQTSSITTWINNRIHGRTFTDKSYGIMGCTYSEPRGYHLAVYPRGSEYLTPRRGKLNKRCHRVKKSRPLRVIFRRRRILRRQYSPDKSFCCSMRSATVRLRRNITRSG